MSKSELAKNRSDVATFVEAARSLTVNRSGSRGRLVFALDATASRQPSWDMASHVQSEMFLEAGKLGALSVQLVFYRGFEECRHSRFVENTEELVKLMSKVRCAAGRTQIGRVLRHALKLQPSPQALVFIGDACEEEIDKLGDLAGQLGLKGVRAFMFQEGRLAEASLAFGEIAKLTKGAHCRFEPGAANELRQLLGAVAAFTTGGVDALRKLPKTKATALLSGQVN